MKKTWFNVENIGETEKKVLIYDEIGGWGIRAIDLINEINSGNTKLPLNVYINSPGGDLIDAIAIFNAIKRYDGETTAYVDGVAASAASYICMAFDKVVMPKNTVMMIHDPITTAFGNADDMRETADLLDKFKNSIVAGYSDKSGKSYEEIAAMLNAETWLGAEEAVFFGFADEMTEEIAVVAMAKGWNYKNAPQNLIEIQEEKADAIVAQTEQEVAEQPPVETEPAQEPEESAQTEPVETIEPVEPAEPIKAAIDPIEVAEVCNIAKVPNMIADFLKSGKTVGEIKNEIIAMQAAKNSQLEISSIKNLGSSSQAQNSVSQTAEIYARFNQKK